MRPGIVAACGVLLALLVGVFLVLAAGFEPSPEAAGGRGESAGTHTSGATPWESAESPESQDADRREALPDARPTAGTQDGVVCAGEVTDAAGRPVANAIIRYGARGAAGAAGAAGACRTRSAADGSYRLQGLPPGAIRVEAQEPEHGQASVELQGRAGDTLRWDPVLSRGLVFVGLVVDEADEPLDGVKVEASGGYGGAGRDIWFRHTNSDERGRFVFNNCAPNKSMRLQLRKLGYKTRAWIKIDPAQTAEKMFRLRSLGEATARIHGTVVDPQGRPVAATLLLTERDSSEGASHRTDEVTGRFDITRLYAGRYKVGIQSDTCPWYQSEEQKLAAGQTWDLGTIRLRGGGRILFEVEELRPKDSGQYSLTVLDHKGERRFSTTLPSPMRMSLPNGFRTEPLPPGQYHVWISGPAVRLDRLPVAVRADADSKVKVKLRAGMRRAFELASPADAPQRDRLKLVLTAPGGLVYPSQLVRAGLSPFRTSLCLQPGRYTLEAKTDAGYRGRLQFEVQATEAAYKTLKVALRR